MLLYSVTHNLTQWHNIIITFHISRVVNASFKHLYLNKHSPRYSQKLVATCSMSASRTHYIPPDNTVYVNPFSKILVTQGSL